MKSAAAREATALEEMLSPAIVARAGKDGIQKVLSGQVVPFFADHKDLGRSVTTTNTTDAGGNLGLAYSMYSVSETGEQNSLVIYNLRRIWTESAGQYSREPFRQGPPPMSRFA